MKRLLVFLLVGLWLTDFVSAQSFIMESRKVAPGSVVWLKATIETATPVRGIDLVLWYPSLDTLAPRSSFWPNWGLFYNWLVAQYTTSDSDHIAMASRYPFVGSGVLGSFRIKVGSGLNEGTVVNMPVPTVSFNDTINPVIEGGYLTIGPKVKFGDVNGDSLIKVGDVNRLLDIIIPDSSTLPASLRDSLAADVTGDGELDTWDGYDILYKVVNPYYFFLVEDRWYGIGIGKGEAPLVLEESPVGVTLKMGSDFSFHNGDILIEAPAAGIAKASEGAILARTVYKIGKNENQLRLGFISTDDLHEGKILFLPGVKASEVKVSGKVNEGIPVKVSIQTVTAVEYGPIVPTAFSLEQNYPNPFNPTTTIRYSLTRDDFVTLSVFDLLGREVATLVREEKEAGDHSMLFDAGDLPSGIYLYRLTTSERSFSRRMVLLR